MIHHSDSIASQDSKRGGLEVPLALGLVFLITLGYQLIRSMRIDAYELTQTHADLIGYWLVLLISILLGLRLVQQGRIRFIPLFLVGFLIIYISFIIILTKPSHSIVDFLISRYGILLWFIMGIGFAGFLDVLRKSRQTKYLRVTRLMVIGALIFLGAQTVSFAQQYISSPEQSLRYQSVADNAAIFLMVIALTIDTLWCQKKPLLLSVAYLIVGTVLVAAIVLLQSTSIVVFWVGLSVIFFYKVLADSRFLEKMALGVFAAIAVVYLMNLEIFEVIARMTRFSVFFEGEGVFSPVKDGRVFSSISNRFALLGTFIDQFSVSPLFGHFEAEVLAGAGQGRYLHSVPLSFLTHTGLLGTALFIIAFIFLLRGRVFVRDKIDPTEIQILRITILILVLGSISTFLTWSVLWFIMGVLCGRPATVIERS